MSEPTLLSEWKDTELLISEKDTIKGSLRFFTKTGTHYFTWVPQETAPGNQRVFIMLHQMSIIQIKPMSISRTGLDFSFKDFTKFPTISFSAFAASQLLSYMANKQLISLHKNDANVIATARIQSIMPESFIHSSRFISLLSHRKTLKELIGVSTIKYGEQGLTQADIKASQTEDGVIRDFDSMKRVIQNRGLSDFSRAAIWPYILGVYSPSLSLAQKKYIDARNMELYNRLESMIHSLTCKQISKFTGICELIQTNINELMAKDPIDEEVSKIIYQVLIRYSVLCPDIGYHQSMEYILSTLCYAFISEIQPGLIKARDGTMRSFEEFGSFLLACFRGYLNLGSRFRLLEFSQETQFFFTERINKIIELTHLQLSNWLALYGLNQSDFLYHFACNGYSALFSKQTIIRAWDISFSSHDSDTFYIFFSAALLILCFGKFFLNATIRTESFRSEFETIARSIDINTAINLTKNIISKLRFGVEDAQGIFIPLRARTEFLDYVPKYISIETRIRA